MKLCPICATSYPDGHRTCPTHGAVLVDTPELPPGTMIRDCYRIERTLGKGGMGIVYLAEHTLMGEPRALKFLSGALASNPTFVQRFLQEARAANKLRHPNIAQTLELGQSEDGSFYISMEFVDGPSLRAILDQSPYGLPPDRAFNIARGVAEALGAAHAKHMVHRDIKPENILLAWNAESETAKVVDFGIVAITDSVGRLTQTGKPLMTAQYAAPEQWRGTIAPSELDGRTDLYALGCMFYEMLTGQLPFYSESYEGWFEQHVHGAARPPSEIQPALKQFPGLDALVLQLMAKEREDRPANVKVFLADLDQVIAGKAQAGVSGGAFAPGKNGAAGVQAAGAQGGGTGLPAMKPAVGIPPGGLRPVAGPAGGPAGGPGTPAKLSKNARIAIRVAGAAVLLAVAGMILALILRKDDAASSDHGSVSAPVSGPGSGASATSGGTPSTPASLPVPEAAPTPTPRPVQPTPSSSTSTSTGDLAASVRQAKAYYRDKEYAEAAPLFARGCERGDAESCDYIGWMYEYHQGVEQNYSRALTLYDRGCTMGNMPSCTDEGAMYEDHVGVAQNYERALQLYTKACDGGSPSGCDYEGYLYQTGEGTAQNYQEALALYDKSCTANGMGGCKDMGWMYQHGLGVKQDYPRAMSYYSRACDADESTACNSLGIMYEEHQGVAEDDTRAVFFYTKSCDSNNASGCSDLGNMYRYGKGTTKDLEKAKTLLTKGCNLGSKYGCDQLKEMQGGKS